MEVRDSSSAAGEQTVTEYHGRHILVRVDDNQTDAAAKAKIDTLRARIAGGADLTVARESSEDNNSKGQGGDLGWFPADAFGPAFGQQVSGLQDGGSASRSAPTPVGTSCSVATRQTDVTTDNQRAQVRETIGRRKLEDEYNRFLQELRGEAYVSFRSGDRAENTATSPQSDRCAPSSLWYRASPPGSARSCVSASSSSRVKIAGCWPSPDPCARPRPR